MNTCMMISTITTQVIGFEYLMQSNPITCERIYYYVTSRYLKNVNHLLLYRATEAALMECFVFYNTTSYTNT